MLASYCSKFIENMFRYHFGVLENSSKTFFGIASASRAPLLRNVSGPRLLKSGARSNWIRSSNRLPYRSKYARYAFKF